VTEFDFITVLYYIKIGSLQDRPNITIM